MTIIKDFSSPLYIEPSRRTRKGGQTMTDKET